MLSASCQAVPPETHEGVQCHQLHADWEQQLTTKKGVNSTTDFNKFFQMIGIWMYMVLSK